MDGKTVTTSGEYRNDWRYGRWEFRDAQGAIVQTMEYRPEPRRTFGFLITTDYGNENGPYRRYFPDGSLEEEGQFISGYYEGRLKRYHRNGKLALEGTLHRDEPVGLWKSYYASGTLYREMHYQDGKLQGALRVYDPDGRLKYSTEYSAGQKIGPDELIQNP
ncbi:MAG: hypothetical protein HS115_09265 [Spirochaetales bacterium]|nr:hypothetical protein [Spirochaetales bacterium]